MCLSNAINVAAHNKFVQILVTYKSYLCIVPNHVRNSSIFTLFANSPEFMALDECAK